MKKKTDRVRVNERITSTPIRVIDQNGEQIGILPVNEALARARAVNLDLVEIAPNGQPPVCRIMDFGKFKYQQAKKEKQAKKKQHTVQMRAMRYRPKTDEHDYQFKTRHVREFLEQGSKVKVFVMYTGREMARIELGRKILDRVVEDLQEICTIGQEPKLEGRRLTMVLNPKLQNVKAKQKRTENAKDQDQPVSSQAVQEDGDG
ncbi:MAG: translation initiation factor IF-3 [candidate division Zixibacteria bacterium HGW-Zixibacteria-1]|nr:MAG: translation initiation factor IF-3 [candidate division Zixibacteria bacterium HGW-Zixibacteria-1]